MKREAERDNERTVNLAQRLKTEEHEMQNDKILIQNRQNDYEDDKVVYDSMIRLIKEANTEGDKDTTFFRKSFDECAEDASVQLIRRKKMELEKTIKDYVEFTAKSIMTGTTIAVCGQLEDNGMLIGDYERALIALKEKELIKSLESDCNFLSDSLIKYIENVY